MLTFDTSHIFTLATQVDHQINHQNKKSDVKNKKSSNSNNENGDDYLKENPLHATVIETEITPGFLLQGAEKGHPTEQYQVGLLYLSGAGGLNWNLMTALYWFLEAAKQGHPEAQYEAGKLYVGEQGGIKPNYRKAFQLLTKAAEELTEHANLMYLIGNMYYLGKGVDQDQQQAFEYYLKSAKLGEAASQNMVGYMYKEGEGVPKDEKLSLHWYQITAQKGNSQGQFRVGQFHLSGGKDIPVNKELAISYFKKSAAQHHAEANYILGYLHMFGIGVNKNPDAAFDYFHHSAKYKNAEAQYVTGVLCLLGYGTNSKLDEAFFWLNKAVKQKHAGAQCELANMLLFGIVVAQDIPSAIQRLQDSVAQGFAFAERYLGWIYIYGIGVEQDCAEGRRLIESAANRGNKYAQFDLFEPYLEGNYEFPIDINQALKWLKASSDAEFPDAMAIYGEFCLTGNHVQRDDALGIKLLEKAGKLGDTEALQCLGGYALKNKQSRLALDCFTKAADLLSVDAMKRLDQIYRSGEGGVPINLKKADEWKAKANKKVDMVQQARSVIKKNIEQISSTADYKVEVTAFAHVHVLPEMFKNL